MSITAEPIEFDIDPDDPGSEWQTITDGAEFTAPVDGVYQVRVENGKTEIRLLERGDRIVEGAS